MLKSSADRSWARQCSPNIFPLLTKSCGIICVTNCQKTVFPKLSVSGTIPDTCPFYVVSDWKKTTKCDLYWPFYYSEFFLYRQNLQSSLETKLTFGPNIISSSASYKRRLAIKLFKGTFLRIFYFRNSTFNLKIKVLADITIWKTAPRNLRKGRKISSVGITMQHCITVIWLIVYILQMFLHPLQRTNAENSKQIFPEKKLRAATVPISTFMYLCRFYIFPWSIFLFFCREICRPILETYRLISVEIGTEAAQSDKRNT